jgi:hypothetical protein
MIFNSSSINVKIFSDFQKEWCTFGLKKKDLKKIEIIHFQALNVLNMQIYFLFGSHFKHVGFAINRIYSKKFMKV